jgi:hypothetical protein
MTSQSYQNFNPWAVFVPDNIMKRARFRRACYWFDQGYYEFQRIVKNSGPLITELLL